MLVTLFPSYLIWSGLFPEGVFRGNATDPTVFRLHVTQNFFMAFASFAPARLARSESKKALRGLLLRGVLALFNVIFMVQGRTGYLVVALLLIFFFSSGPDGRAWGSGWSRWRF